MLVVILGVCFLFCLPYNYESVKSSFIILYKYNLEIDLGNYTTPVALILLTLAQNSNTNVIILCTLQCYFNLTCNLY